MHRSCAVIAVLAGCWKQPAAPKAPTPVIAAAVAPARIRLRAPDNKHVSLLAATALPDGGLIIVGVSPSGVRIGNQTRCPYPDTGLFITRLDAAGQPRWTRCALGGLSGKIVAAASDTGVWIARIPYPNAPAYVGDVRDLVVVERFTAAGEPAGSRVASVFYDPKHAEYSARNAAENMRLNAATIANGELVIAGSSKTGSIVDGVWRVPDSNISLHGFVLAVPAQGPVRAIFETSEAVVEDVAVANGRFVATGWCGSSTKSSVPPVMRCSAGSTSAYSVDGELAARAAPNVRVFGQDIHGIRGAIADDGSIVVAASAWHTAVIVDGKRLESTCSRFAFVAAYSPTGTLRFARALGDCMQRGPSPLARGGVSLAASDDNISDHSLAIGEVAVVGGAPLVVVGVGADMNHLDWPVRFDHVKLSVPFANAAAALTLDATGKIVKHRSLRVLGPSEQASEPDGTMSSTAGLHRVIVTEAGARAWAIVEHGSGLETEGAKLPVRSWFERELRRGDRSECEKLGIREPPRAADVIEAVGGYGGEPDDFGCRRAVESETAVDAIRL